MDLLKFLKSEYAIAKKACFKGSGEFQCRIFPKGKFYFRPPLTARDWEALVEMEKFPIHSSRRTMIERGSLFKDRKISLCLKHYLPRHLSRARWAFVLSELFHKLKISTPRVLAFVEEKKIIFPGKSILITEFVEDSYELHWQIRQLLRNKTLTPSLLQEKKSLLQGLSFLIAQIQSSGIFHKDFSSQNILVCRKNEGWKYFLVDLEDAQLKGELTLEDLEKNLLQLGDLPQWITPRDKFFFWKHWSEKLSSPLQKKMLDHKKEFLFKVQTGIFQRIEERKKKYERDWMKDLTWIPTKGEVGEEVPRPTLPPRMDEGKSSFSLDSWI